MCWESQEDHIGTRQKSCSVVTEEIFKAEHIIPLWDTKILCPLKLSSTFSLFKFQKHHFCRSVAMPRYHCIRSLSSAWLKFSWPGEVGYAELFFLLSKRRPGLCKKLSQKDSVISLLQFQIKVCVLPWLHLTAVFNSVYYINNGWRFEVAVSVACKT